MEKIKIENIQVSLFFKNNFEDNYFDLAKKIQLIFPESTIDVPGLPEGLPFEVPRLQATFEDFSLGVSRIRIDLFFKEEDKLKNNIKNLYKICNEMKVIVYGIANVTTYSIKERTEEFINSFFTTKVSQNNYENVLLRLGKKTLLNSVEINQNITYQSGLLNGKDELPTPEEVMVITIDTNTIGINKNISEYSELETYNLNNTVMKNNISNLLYK